MLKLLRIELEKLAYSRVYYASLLLLLVYALVMIVGVRTMMAGLPPGADRQSGAAYMYFSMVLSFYPFLTTLALVHAGGSIATETRAGTLRYALIAPIGRVQYVLAKFLVTGFAVATCVAFLFVVVGGLGMLLLGHGNCVTYDLWAPAKMAAREATLLSDDEVLQRCLLAAPLMVVSAMANASFAFVVSVLVKSPLLAIIVPLSLFFIVTIVQLSPLFESLKPHLPTLHMFFWDGVFARTIAWDQIGFGLAYHAGMMGLAVGVAALILALRDVQS